MQKTSKAFMIIIFIAVLFTVGCTGVGSSGPNTAPTKLVVYTTVTTVPLTPTSTNTASPDPIIGVWRYGMEGFDVRQQYEFNADGTSRFSCFTFGKRVISYTGTWQSEGHNIYIVPNPESKREEWFWIYVPSSDTIHNKLSPLVEYHRYKGDPNLVPSGSSPAGSSEELVNISKIISEGY